MRISLTCLSLALSLLPPPLAPTPERPHRLHCPAQPGRGSRPLPHLLLEHLQGDRQARAERGEAAGGPGGGVGGHGRAHPDGMRLPLAAFR